MLVSKYCCRNQNGYLFIIGNGFESRTYRYLGFSKSYISADQTIHRTVTFHIRLDINRRLALIRCIFINKGCFQLTLQETIGTVRETFFLTTLRIQFYQIAGNILDFTLCTFFQFLPCTCT